jgi:hypothetical protein
VKSKKMVALDEGMSVVGSQVNSAHYARWRREWRNVCLSSKYFYQSSSVKTMLVVSFVTRVRMEGRSPNTGDT